MWEKSHVIDQILEMGCLGNCCIRLRAVFERSGANRTRVLFLLVHNSVIVYEPYVLLWIVKLREAVYDLVHNT